MKYSVIKCSERVRDSFVGDIMSRMRGKNVLKTQVNMPHKSITEEKFFDN